MNDSSLFPFPSRGADPKRQKIKKVDKPVLKESLFLLCFWIFSDYIYVPCLSHICVNILWVQSKFLIHYLSKISICYISTTN